MKRSLWVLGALLVMGSACGGESDDCVEGRTLLQQDAHLGESCAVINYGTCMNISSCLEGDCVSNPSDFKNFCRAVCESTAGCDQGEACVDGHCQPPATCKTFCDGTTCCTYAPDPDDPQQCKQTGCTTS